MQNILLFTLGNVLVDDNTTFRFPNEERDITCDRRSQELYDTLRQLYHIPCWICGKYGRNYSKEQSVNYSERIKEATKSVYASGIKIDFSIQMMGHPILIPPHPYFIITDFLPYLPPSELKRLDTESMPIFRKDFTHEQDALYQNASGIICYSPLSHWAMQNYHQVATNRLTTICSGVTGLVPADFQKKLEKILLWVGSDFEQKGGQTVLEAFQILYAEDPSYQLYFVGVDKHFDIPNVTVLPFLNHENYKILEDLYERASIFLLPSHKENLGLVYLEAMCRKTPVIATTRGGMAQIIRQSGGGLVVPPDNANSIVEAVRTMTINLQTYHQYSEQAYRFAVKNASWEIFNTRIMDAIDKWLQNKEDEVPQDYNIYS